MRLAILSDIHVNTYSKWYIFTDKLVEAIIEKEPDLVLIAGDISEDTEILFQFLEFFHKLLKRKGIPFLLVPGNHDVWVMEKDRDKHDSESLYKKVLPEFVSNLSYCHYLPSQPYICGNHAFVGSMGWYDHSFMENSNKHEIRRKLDYYLGKFWADRKFVKWSYELTSRRGNEKLLAEMLAALKRDLDSVKDKENIHITTHMVPHRRFYKPYKEMFFFEAYMGSNRLSELASTYSNVKTYIFGHTHTNFDEVFGKIRYINAAIGLPLQHPGVQMGEYIRRRMVVAEL